MYWIRFMLDFDGQDLHRQQSSGLVIDKQWRDAFFIIRLSLEGISLSWQCGNWAG